MAVVLLDTHSWAWSLNRDRRLSVRAAFVIEEAEAVFVSPVSFYEIGLKTRRGRWSEMEPLVPRLSGLLAEQGGRIAVLSPEVALLAASLDWNHRDPFDRLLAATAIVHRLTLISVDAAFDQLAGRNGWSARVW